MASKFASLFDAGPEKPSRNIRGVWTASGVDHEPVVAWLNQDESMLRSRPGRGPLTAHELYIELCKPRFRPSTDSASRYLDQAAERRLMSINHAKGLCSMEPHNLQPNGWRRRAAQQGSSHGILLKGITRPEISVLVNGVTISALADTGSCVDVMSESLANRLQICINRSRKRSIKLPKGRMNTTGMALVDFQFQNESATYQRWFDILENSFYDVLLGRPFLDMTETLTKFKERIQQKLVPCIQTGERIFLIGDAQSTHLACSINGRPAWASPDTGSDMMVVSGDFASRNQLRVRSGRKYRRRITFVDGSSAVTDGMVLGAELQVDLPDLPFGCELRYSDYARSMKELLPPAKPFDESRLIYDLHVLKGLPYDIILSNQFIEDHQIFARYAQLALSRAPYSRSQTISSLDLSLGPALCVIRDPQGALLERLKTKLRRQHHHHIVDVPSPSTWEGRKFDEEARRNQRDAEVAGLPTSEQAAARAEESRRREQWALANPPPSIPRPPSPSNSTPVASRSPTSIPALLTSPTSTPNSVAQGPGSPLPPSSAFPPSTRSANGPFLLFQYPNNHRSEMDGQVIYPQGAWHSFSAFAVSFVRSAWSAILKEKRDTTVQK